MTFEYWYMFPISIVIATTAMASGIEGATFFAPFFMIVLRLPPDIAIGTGLITEVFGFGSGLLAYIFRRLIDYKLSAQLLMMTIPMAIIGTLVANYIPAFLLKTIFALGLLAVAIGFLRAKEEKEIKRLDQVIKDEYGGEKAERCILTRKGEEIHYKVCNRVEGGIYAGIGALFVGMIATGLGELNGYFLLKRCKVPSKVAIASSVFVVSITILIASIGHFINFARTGGETLDTVLNLVIFTIPGVIIGGQLGPFVSKFLSQKTLERTLGVLFIIVALVTFGETIFSKFLS